MEEVCSYEEAREVFEDTQKTVSQTRSLPAGAGASQFLSGLGHPGLLQGSRLAQIWILYPQVCEA